MAGPPIGHPVVIVTREEALPVLTGIVCVLVTSTLRGHPADVLLGRAEGLRHESAANCDNLLTVRVDWLRRRLGHLAPDKVFELDRALRVALGLP
jgi:mRNA interferase MazF